MATTLARNGTHALRLAGACCAAALLACSKGDAGDAGDARGEGREATPAAASAASDMARLEDFELTLPRVQKLQVAMRNMEQAVRAKPALENAGGSGNNASLDDMVANVERVPEFRRAVKDAGLSTREYVLTTTAVFQAGMAQAVLQTQPANANRDSIIREMKVNPKNIAFLKEHEAELKKMEQAMKSAGGGT